MTNYKVKFLPDEKEVEVAEGITLLEAVEKADIYINGLCGGEGLCGECCLQVTSGKARADKNAIGFFSKEEIENGYVLACQTKVEDNEPRYILAFPEESETGEAITISESEIGNLIKSKGAVFAAMKSLIDYVGLTFDQLNTIYVAGGFGSSLDIPKAVAIGLLPDVDTSKIQFIGNSSIMGARMALLSTPAFEKAVDIAKKTTNIELSNYLPFMNEFMAALFLPHTDSNLFSSVHY